MPHKMNNSSEYFLLLLTCFLIIIQTISIEDTIISSGILRDGETIVSSNGTFELGFFSPGNSTNRYVGIWYRNISDRTVVWVANRQLPIPDKSGILRVTPPGILVLFNGTNGTVWSTNTSRSVQNPVAQLLDSGNFVVREANGDKNFLWQSFDHPTDTFIPGMKFGLNFETGAKWFLYSWKNADDPAIGDYAYYVDPTGYPQIYTTKDGVKVLRYGPWNGRRFSGATNGLDDPLYRNEYVMNENELSYLEEIDRSVPSRSTLNRAGVIQQLYWIERAQQWRSYFSIPTDNCDTYNLCGVYASCNIANPRSCQCLDKFVRRDRESSLRADWSNGCIRRTNLSCEGDVFLKYSGMKLPDVRNSQYKENGTLKECREECLRNCSCMAYSQFNLSSRSGCFFWSEDLVDMRELSQDGQDIYIRIAASELESDQKKPRTLIISISTPVIGIIFLVLGLFVIHIRRKNHSIITKGKHSGINDEESELPLFKYSVISKATDYFSDDNKLGEGGFGPVFKGTLEDGQEIAVKRLSNTSSQGVDEFKNEAIFIAKLQHRNLVKLLGCCIQGDEYILIYEYMPRKSLDVVLFNQPGDLLLDWPKRFNIINGIARGLLYLHQDSRLRIIHRDLKASNILLDSDMNPKISDFGTARSFRDNDTAAKTHRIIGTYGYMSPEYAVDGLFSIKSDIFSFGVLVLEIVSGKANRGFSHNNHLLNLLGHAWTLYKEERSLELVDPSLDNSFDLQDVLRSIHIALLCVQKRPEDRPNTSSVVLMLSGEGILPPAHQPGFFTEREVAVRHSTSSTISENEVTITMPEGR